MPPAKKKTVHTKAAPTAEVNGSQTQATNGKSKKGLLSSASNVVFRAAEILEEEIARGIVAAKQIEEKLTDVPRLRSGQATKNPQMEDLFVRFRKDAHDIIDL